LLQAALVKVFSASKTFEDELSTLARFYTWLDESKV
jgi:hypothetical protein